MINNGYNTGIFKQIQTNILTTSNRKYTTPAIPKTQPKKESFIQGNRKCDIYTKKNNLKHPSRLNRYNSSKLINKKSPSRDKKSANTFIRKTPMRKKSTNAIQKSHKKNRSTIEYNHNNNSNVNVKRTPSRSPSRPKTPVFDRKDPIKKIQKTPDRHLNKNKLNLGKDVLNTHNSKSPLRNRNNNNVTSTKAYTNANTNSNNITLANNNNINGSKKYNSKQYNGINSKKEKYNNPSDNNKMTIINDKNKTKNTKMFDINNNKNKKNNIIDNNIMNEEVFQSFGIIIPKKTIPEQNIKNTNQRSKPITKNNSNNSYLLPTYNNQNYQLPEENCIEFNELDQFSPPYLGQQINLNYIESNNNYNTTIYTNFEQSKQHNTLNANPMTLNSNRQLIDDFISKIDTGKKYSTIEYKNAYQRMMQLNPTWYN